ncbi:MAG: hypothetical protein HDS88_05285 [Bacteroidales bacterium]|nr:hypothetical protein [Bacteroidales bacterium]
MSKLAHPRRIQDSAAAPWSSRSANILIVKRVWMLPGASAEYISLFKNVQHIKNIGCINL